MMICACVSLEGRGGGGCTRLILSILYLYFSRFLAVFLMTPQIEIM
jgi:hypothetical protein